MPADAARPIEGFRIAAWLNRDRVVTWCTILLGLQAALLVFIACWQHGAFGPVVPTSSDFVSFYAAGKLVLAGTPALAYDQTAHELAEQAARGGGAPYQFFFYPPVYLLVCAGLATLPYYAAFAVFQLATLAPFLLIARAILREHGWAWAAPVLAFPPVFWTIGLGQNAFLTAALFGGFSLLLDRKPITAGMLMGTMCYKPHFGVLVPIALIAGGHWRAFAAAAATLCALVGLTIVLFGAEIWWAYLAATMNAKTVFASGRIDFAGMVSIFGAERLMGFATGPAYALQAVASLEMVMLVALIWRRVLPPAIRFATLLAATLLAVPVTLVYDHMLLLLAMLWLVREAKDTGFHPWERLGLAGIYAMALVTWLVGTLWHLPLGPIAPSVLLLLCVRRLWRAPAVTQPRVA
jgi:alpha-1,2-mannosyltransferase